MENDHETGLKQEKPRSGQLDRRQIFVSHAHADRKLALEVRSLIEGAFSGLVTAYVSSDPTPTGGVKPEQGEWYSQIHNQLRASDSVWVLATPTSVTHPWIYWEAGFGRAICPGSLAVLRVGVGNKELPSPLANFQAYDGYEIGDGGVGELVGKIGEQIGMKVHPILIEAIAKDWVSAAKNHKPESGGKAESPEITPEHLDQFGALIARLEAAVTSLPPVSPRFPRLPQAGMLSGEDGPDAELRARVLGSRLVGIFTNVGGLTRVVDAAPAETAFRFVEIDWEGDAQIEAERDSESVHVWLLGAALETLSGPVRGSKRVRALIREIREGLGPK